MHWPLFITFIINEEYNFRELLYNSDKSFHQKINIDNSVINFNIINKNVDSFNNNNELKKILIF